MADKNIKDYTVTWITFALLFFSLISFASLFMASNNPTGLGDSANKFNLYNTQINSQLIQVQPDVNKKLNTSAIIGSDSQTASTTIAVSNSYGFWDSASNIFPQIKDFILWMFPGVVGKIIVAVFFGLAGFIALFYIIKLGRSLL